MHPKTVTICCSKKKSTREDADGKKVPAKARGQQQDAERARLESRYALRMPSWSA